MSNDLGKAGAFRLPASADEPGLLRVVVVGTDEGGELRGIKDGATGVSVALERR